jgi:hypothetical protein
MTSSGALARGVWSTFSDRIRAHAFRHEELSGRVDHSIFFGNQIPRRLYFPSGFGSLLLNARDGDWPLGCSKEFSPFRRCMLRERGAKCLLWHPNEPMCVRCQLRRLRMRLLTIEHFGDCLTFVRRQGRYEDQRSDSLIGSRRYHGARISVGYQDHGAISAFQGAVKRGDVMRHGRQWDWGCDDVEPLGQQWPNDVVPA